VFVPRERDIQKNEVIVDNEDDIYSEKSGNINFSWMPGKGSGFLKAHSPYPIAYNPFKKGTHRIINADTITSAEAEWIPDIPVEGYYFVSITYNSSENNINDARYSVYHSGGVTDFLVNQQIGGSTWIYLGRFKFKKGINPETGKVVLKNFSDSPIAKIISADAVRFGGGMGIVERGGSTSGRAKFLEGARYWLQFAGMPDTLVYNLNKSNNDYNDDYQSRGEFVNYLYGNPYGPNKKRDEPGLGIPIDLSLAFHTDAGITDDDSTIGTLAIYSIEGFDSQYVFPDGISRLANRDLSDIVQTQIVQDIRDKYDFKWNRRQLMEAQYSEAVRPNVPAMLLELLSHQNFTDMKFVLDPSFRFDVARAIYKGMLRFLSAQNSTGYTVQPLPVTYFSTDFNSDGDILLKWKSRQDPLEPSAVPKGYLIYTRIDDGGFDNGIFTNDTVFVFKQFEMGKIYSFKVTAVNDGGESFPSEILSVCKLNDKKPVLIINCFDRISSPASIETPGFKGFLNFIDAGVPYLNDFNFTGTQYDFDPSSKFRSNDSPGHGASNSDYETEIIAGNTFDFPFVHGESIKEAGYSFVSTSDESVIEGLLDLQSYDFISFILGEEKETNWQTPIADSLYGPKYKIFPKSFQEKISEYLTSGGNVFLSGAYVGTDLFSGKDSSDIKWALETLKFNWQTGHADKSGEVISIDSTFILNEIYRYNVQLNDSIYAVESPDEITPVNGSKIILRYNRNNFSAATAYKNEYGVIVFGFPFETITGKEQRNNLMKSIIKYFGL
jgi:hypothetical protein